MMTSALLISLPYQIYAAISRYSGVYESGFWLFHANGCVLLQKSRYQVAAQTADKPQLFSGVCCF